MTDYSHPRYYFVIAIIGIILSVLSGFTISRGFYFGVLGLGIFPAIWFYAKEEYLRDERSIFFELALSFLGFIFLPIGYFFHIYVSIIPTTVDFLFFFIGYSAMALVTSLLYLIEPETNRQLAFVIAIASVFLFVTIVLIKVFTIAGYLGATT